MQHYNNFKLMLFSSLNKWVIICTVRKTTQQNSGLHHLLLKLQSKETNLLWTPLALCWMPPGTASASPHTALQGRNNSF